MKKDIAVIWMNEDIPENWYRDEIIFIDRMPVEEFKQIHGVSPHYWRKTGILRPKYDYCDVIVKITSPMV